LEGFNGCIGGSGLDAGVETGWREDTWGLVEGLSGVEFSLEVGLGFGFEGDEEGAGVETLVNFLGRDTARKSEEE
jgi:hypothetical protein